MPRPPKLLSETDPAIHLRDFLIRDDAPGGGRLFANPTAVGAAVVAGTPEVDTRAERGTKNLVAQVMRGERNCPDHLRTSLTVALHERLADQSATTVAEWDNRLNEEIDAMHRARAKQEGTVSRFSADFMNTISRAGHRLVVSPMVGGLAGDNTKVARAFVRTLGLSGNRLPLQCRTDIWCVDYAAAAEVWKTIFVEAMEQSGGRISPSEMKEKAAQLARSINAADLSGYVNVYVTPVEYHLTPVILNDLHLQSRSGFVVIREKMKLRELRLPSQFVDRWRQVYGQFELRKIDGVERVEFSTYEPRLVQEVMKPANNATSTR